MKVKISVVVPIYNEEGNIEILYSKLKQTLQKIDNNFEIIFINDGSIDNSYVLLKKIARGDKKVKLISFSRNFGHMSAINAGLENSTGERVVVMDADMQDPPFVIEKMYKKSLEGFDVVYGIKKKRKESFIRVYMMKVFYRLLGKISNVKIPLDAGTFSLISRKVVDHINKLPERNKYFSGLRAWAGYNQTGVTYERAKRYKGKEASYARLFKLAMDQIVSFSFVPLKLASILGFIFSAVAFLMIIVLFVLKFFVNLGIVGWTSTITTILLIGGVQLITLGIIGEYLARIYDEVKHRPEYIVGEKINF
ncbi:MAG: glycosyltransferase family 2 protein [Patescibacteria group bacterium]